MMTDSTASRGPAACTECRKHKIRCRVSSSAGELRFDLPCERCSALSAECTYPAHRRGRRRKDGTSPAGQRFMPGDASSSSVRTIMHEPTAQDDAQRVESPSQSGDSDADGGLPPLHFMGADDAPPSTSLRTMMQPWQSQRGRGSTKDNAELSPRVTTGPGVRQVGSPAGDPISTGMLSESEAKMLFALYMAHCNAALPLVDSERDHYERVKASSPFLFTAILCVASRYIGTDWCRLPYRSTVAPPDSPESVHQRILVLSRDHLIWAFAEASCSIDVLQALCILFIFKEPEDAQAGFYFSRAVLLAQELQLGRLYTSLQVETMSPDQRGALRVKQRTWLLVYIANSIFHMQFGQKMLIDDTDPLIHTASHYLRRSSPSDTAADTYIVYSVEMRKKYTYYRRLVQRPESTATVDLALSITARRINTDWEATVKEWEHDMWLAKISPAQIAKSRVWSWGLQLGLNLIILQQAGAGSIRTTTDVNSLAATTADHHATIAATSILEGIHQLESPTVTFATDTLLHFYLYAACYLCSMCRKRGSGVGAEETDRIRQLVHSAAGVLETASAYPSDSPSLHATRLRRLLSRAAPHEPAVRIDAPSNMPSDNTLPVQSAFFPDQSATFNVDTFDFAPMLGDMFMPMGDTFDDFLDLSWLDASNAPT